MAVAKSPTKAIPSLPKDWELNELGDVIDFVGGAQPPASTFIRKQMNGYIRLIQIRDYKTNEYETYIPENLARKRCDKDDVMIGRYGPPIFQILKGIDGAYNVALMKAIPKGKLTKNYMWHFLRQNCLLDFVEGLSQRSSGQTGVELPALKKYPFPLPNREEQDRIANCLSDVDSMIESVEKLIAKKRDIKQATMQQLLTGKTRLPGFSGPWIECTWGDLIKDCTSGATPFRGNTSFYKGNIRWITSGELNFNFILDTLEHISEEAVRKTNLKIHPSGTFLMAITGLEAAGTRGACAIVGLPSTTNQSCMAIYPNEKLKTKYLYHFYRLFGDELALKYCQGTKQQSYTAGIVRKLPIKIPIDTAEQSAIADIFDLMDSELECLENKHEKLKLLKQGMMQDLLTGRIRLI